MRRIIARRRQTTLLPQNPLPNLAPVDPDHHVGRKHLPHFSPIRVSNRSTVIFVTVAVHQRRPILARQAAVDLLLDSWTKARHWQVGRYVIMPDHLHFFCSPVNSETSLPRWMQYWRADSTRRWPFPDDKPVWQRDYFDRQLRAGESYREKWKYVRDNPIRADLVKHADDWPWQGELNQLLWHDP